MALNGKVLTLKHNVGHNANLNKFGKKPKTFQDL